MILTMLIFKEIQFTMFTNSYNTQITSSTYSRAVQGKETIGHWQTHQGFIGDPLFQSIMAAPLVKGHWGPLLLQGVLICGNIVQQHCLNNHFKRHVCTIIINNTQSKHIITSTVVTGTWKKDSFFIVRIQGIECIVVHFLNVCLRTITESCVTRITGRVSMTTAETKSVPTSVHGAGSLPGHGRATPKALHPRVERMLASRLYMAAVAARIAPREIQVWTVWNKLCVGCVTH